MAKGFWQNVRAPSSWAGFTAIGAFIIILSGIGMGFSSTLAMSCGAECVASNLAIALGGMALFITFLDYTRPGKKPLAGLICIAIAIILIAADYVGWAGSRPLLIGSVFLFVGGLFSLIASRR
jgi:hypothetical protein